MLIFKIKTEGIIYDSQFLSNQGKAMAQSLQLRTQTNGFSVSTKILRNMRRNIMKRNSMLKTAIMKKCNFFITLQNQLVVYGFWHCTKN